MTSNYGLGAASVEGLEVLVEADAGEGYGGGTKGLRRRGRGGADLEVANVPADRLRDNLERTVASLRGMFDTIAQEQSAFPLKEVQVSFEISAKGGIRLIGTSEVEGKGGITLVFGARDRQGAES
ncbi:hypothetical protein [Streptomyces sp. HB132]|uniref:Pepco domain-containing protein n=1 Tax=Streptomyces sp. HB132 TaxID=767388 RepID=UPI00195FBF97|nr:hypothetical protein [Streptomyces sp. HB132]MBM7437131.1 hypothetical protein [Streptomyces sp. HB132]